MCLITTVTNMHAGQEFDNVGPGFLSNNYSTSVYENATIGTRLEQLNIGALCIDNTAVTYSTNATAFSIDSTSGVISTAQSLDYETQQLYQFPIEARGASRTYTANITIIVLDVNDNSPVFNQLVYTSTLPSGALTEWSTAVLATDQDSGSNAAITYSITDGDTAGIFAINSTTGEIGATGTLDAGKFSNFILIVNATDGGNPIRNDQVAVVIFVPCGSKAPRHSARLPLYALLISLALLVSAALGM